VISDDVIERFLGPLLGEWNRLGPDLRTARSVPLASDPSCALSFLGEHLSPYGYDCVQLELRREGQFALRLQIEGRPGDLSLQTHHPVVSVEGDEAACLDWMEAAAS